MTGTNEPLNDLGWTRLITYQMATGLAYLLAKHPAAHNPKKITIVVDHDGLGETEEITFQHKDEETISEGYASTMLTFFMRVSDEFASEIPLFQEEDDDYHG